MNQNKLFIFIIKQPENEKQIYDFYNHFPGNDEF
jgi:hypothetical protein